jgi:TolA-binding protein
VNFVPRRGLDPVRALATIVGIVACVSAARADATRARASGHALAAASDSIPANTLRLRRAATDRRRSDPAAVIDDLEPIDFSTQPDFDGADRAAFLLARAYLGSGARVRFRALADAVGGWRRPTPYTRWIVYERDLLALADGDSSALETLARSGAPGSASLELWLEARARARSGGDVLATLASLSAVDTTNTLDRELAAQALILRARDRLSRGEDPSALLESVPRGSRLSARARHLLGLAEIERGDTLSGRRTLESLLVEDSTYDGARLARLSIAGMAMDSRQWEAGYESYAEDDRDWLRNRDALQRMLSGDEDDALWAAWSWGAVPSDAVILDLAAPVASGERLADRTADLDSIPTPDLPPLEAPAPSTALRWNVAPPSESEWREVAASRNAIDETAYRLERTRREAEHERAALEERRRYLGVGLDRVRSEEDSLNARAAFLDSLRRSLETLDERIRAVRDEAVRRVLSRALRIEQRSDDHRTWTAAMRFFHLDSPDSAAGVAPDGFPGAGRLLGAEDTLARAIRVSAESLASSTPGLVERSYRQAWRPRLIDRGAAEAAEAARMVLEARRIERTIDSTLTAASTSARLESLETAAGRLSRALDAGRIADRALRARVAHRAVERALQALESEREGIDYGLAASAYGASVGLGRADSMSTLRVDAAGDSADAPEKEETRVWRTHAREHLRVFLEMYPSSPARADARFRLADVELIEARQEFHDEMAHFVRAQSNGVASGALPVLDASASLALYRTMLREDRSFAHLDAVLFNAGTILADQADPEAMRLFDELVTRHPDSRYCQEAYLRMGESRFDERRYSESVPLFERAAAGPDTTMRAIALYKMGWAHFSEDRFLEAADAFRAILDLDSSGTRTANRVNLRDEAEAYLVHSFARADGARSFAQYFDRIGPRPYERRLLRALGQHFRRYSLYAQASDADQLYLARYPLDPATLEVAARRVETFRRWDRAALERAARLEYAPRFAPGSDWSKAQDSDSLRAAGAEFARACWTTVALDRHREARTTGSREAWRDALSLYEKVIAHWPDDPSTPALELRAGEAGAELGDRSGALEHHARAARTGSDSIATQALWQRVAVTDDWYRSTRASSRPGALGSDSLAHAVIAAADEMLGRFPKHSGAADLMWRQGNLAFAHGWYERAADDFARLSTRVPGDARAPRAAILRADALFRLDRFADAGEAFEAASAAARKAGIDSLARRAEQAVPVCYYRDAEAAVARDSSNYEDHARRFEKVATRWPAYPHADLARYRAGLAWAKAHETEEAVRSMQALLRDFPRSAYARDARLELGTILEAQGDRGRAAEAYADFAARYPRDDQAGPATLKAADLFSAVGSIPRADSLRLGYVRAHPEDRETAMEVYEGLARRELAGVDDAHPISTLIGASASTRAKKKTVAVKTSRLAEYLRRAEANPKLASKSLIAQVRFLEGEESRAGYLALSLRQPLAKSIAAKQQRLNATVERYRKCVDLGSAEWSHAATFRIGQSLVAFGEALEKSERPADLRGDDLKGYEEVLARQAQTFAQRGEDVWTDLLRSRDRSQPLDSWLEQTQTVLWRRLGDRFFYRPEIEFPSVKDAPSGAERDEHRGDSTGAALRDDRRGTPENGENEAP